MDKSKDLDQIIMSFNLSNKALSEIKVLRELKDENDSMNKMIENLPIKFYEISLHYVFISEFKKLFEKNRNSERNAASLERFIEKYFPELEDKLSPINRIKKSTFFERICKLRDKKFMHTDGDGGFSPLSIPLLEKEEMSLGFEYLEECLKLINAIHNQWGKGELHITIPDRDERMKNFLMYHQKYQNFYNSNWKQAIQEGFEI